MTGNERHQRSFELGGPPAQIAISARSARASSARTPAWPSRACSIAKELAATDELADRPAVARQQGPRGGRRGDFGLGFEHRRDRPERRRAGRARSRGPRAGPAAGRAPAGSPGRSRGRHQVALAGATAASSFVPAQVGRNLADDKPGRKEVVGHRCPRTAAESFPRSCRVWAWAHSSLGGGGMQPGAALVFVEPGSCEMMASGQAHARTTQLTAPSYPVGAVRPTT